MRFLRDFMARGTVLFVSHDSGAVINLCHRALWLHEGRVVADGAPADVVNAYLANLAGESPATPRDNAQVATPSDADARAFGRGGARIADVALLDAVVGFILKDRLGQVLFSENTFAHRRSDSQGCAPESVLEARFEFILPSLAAGDYVIGAAIADGTQMSHVQHHWVHDALAITAVPNRPWTGGLLGVPMQGVSLVVRPPV
jgi:lipopolysaccharide transport system ATP-binding protein